MYTTRYLTYIDVTNKTSSLTGNKYKSQPLCKPCLSYHEHEKGRELAND